MKREIKLKTTEQIEQLAKKLISGNDIPAIDIRIGVKLGYAKCQEDMAQEWFLNDTPLAFGQEFAYAKGYAQCQEDMAKKYTEKDLRQAMIVTLVSNTVKGSKDIDDYINNIK